MTKYAIIVAGGVGSRFGGAVPKQFLPLGEKTVLMTSIDKFVEEDTDTKIIVVLPSHQVDEWKHLCNKYNYSVEHRVVEGGESRFHSVRNALDVIFAEKGDLIAVHDGVRPLVPVSVIREAYLCAAHSGAVVPVVPVTDSVRCLDGENTSVALNRNSLRAVQTPQTFDALTLKNAYSQPFSSEFTDDASVVERAGGKVVLMDGDVANIKITHSIDLLMAQELLRRNG